MARTRTILIRSKMTAQDIINGLAGMAESVESGNTNPIDALAIIRRIEKIVTDVKAVIDPMAIEEALKYPKEFELNGIIWTRRDGTARYDYKDVPTITTLKEDMEAEQERSKRATRMLMDQRGTLTPEGYVIDPGGIIIGYPAKVSMSKDMLVASNKRSNR